jgi:hypothetical protein
MRNTPLQQEQDVLQKIAQVDYALEQRSTKRPSVPVHYTDPDLDTIPAGYQWLLASDPSTGATVPTVHKVYDGVTTYILSQSDHTHAVTGYRARCELTRSALWTHNSTANFLSVPWDVEIEDTDNMHSIVANTDRIQVPSTAWYEVGFMIAWASNANFRRIGVIFDGATTTAQIDEIVRDERSPSTSGSAATCQGHRTIKLNDGDIIRVGAYQNSGGNLDVTYPGAGAQTPFFYCHQVSDAE